MRYPNAISSTESRLVPHRPWLHRYQLRGGGAVLVVLMALSGVVFASPKTARMRPLQRASVLSREATRLFHEGKPSLAAELFRQAYALDPHPGYLYSAGRAWTKARHFALARDAYDRVLHMTAKGTDFHLRATSRLSELKILEVAADSSGTKLRSATNAAGGPMKREARPGTRVIGSNAIQNQASARATHLVAARGGRWRARFDAWRRPAAMVAWAVSAGAGVFGGVAAVRWRRARTDYAESLNSEGQVVGLTLGEARAKVTTQNRHLSNLWISAGVAAVGLVAGGLLWRRVRGDRSAHERSGGPQTSSLLTVSPILTADAQGASVRVRF